MTDVEEAVAAYREFKRSSTMVPYPAALNHQDYEEWRWMHMGLTDEEQKRALKQYATMWNVIGPFIEKVDS
jgi:hypothetical protein